MCVEFDRIEDTDESIVVDHQEKLNEKKFQRIESNGIEILFIYVKDQTKQRCVVRMIHSSFLIEFDENFDHERNISDRELKRKINEISPLSSIE